MNLTRLITEITNRVPDGHARYNGPYHGGEANYVYIPDDRNHIFDGSFDYILKLGEKAKGQYKDDRKTGDWEFRHRGHTTQKLLHAQYEGGRLEGKLEYFSQEKRFANVYEVHLSLTMHNDQVVGDVYGTFSDGELVAQCNNDSYPDGQWMFRYDKRVQADTMSVELWENGHIVDFYTEWKDKRKPVDPTCNLLNRLNSILLNVIHQLLAIVRRGVNTTHIKILSKR